MSELLQGDCLIRLKELKDNSIDAIITDPPYELGFMGKKWDNSGIAYNVEMWKECLRVLKPGGHLLSFGGTRTYHRMAVAIEDAGFEIRDMIEWVYGSGFPKSRNIGLDVDKKNGVTKNRGKAFVVAGQSGQRDKDTGGDLVPGSNTIGAYVAKNEWSGWGTALKPAHEPICMARKPLAEKTVAKNVLKWSTGGINIDESRVGTSEDIPSRKADKDVNYKNVGQNYSIGIRKEFTPTQGRFPANLIHDNSEEVRECFPESKGGGGHSSSYNPYGGNSFNASITQKKIEKPTIGMNDSGNASRFFKSIVYIPKASKSERNMGCEELEEHQIVTFATANGTSNKPSSISEGRNTIYKNNHPTVKPVALMEYLIKMVTPKGGIVLDPFMGSGTTGIACCLA